VSYAAEPYAQFADDLLTTLTGGVAREQFLFVPEAAPFRLAPPGPLVKGSLRVFGQAGGAFASFRPDRDFALTADNAIEWKARQDGTPAADAVWPDLGTLFFASYDHLGDGGPAPRLTDRNPGSVTRLLAESFGRELAVLSRQLEGVYRAGFLDTAGGRDLEQLVALLGLARRSRSFAAGTVVFARSSPAAADVFIPAGTRLSTAQPPFAEFETTEDRTLRRGALSVEAPVRALASGEAGVVGERAVTVIHRPIFGVESASNPLPTRFAGGDETDAELRARARRALPAAGRATLGAMLAALATLPGVREKDIRVDDDPLDRPGVVTVSIAAPLDAAGVARAVELIEANRPAGVRVLHNLDAPLPLDGLTPGPNPVDEQEPPAEATTAPGALYLGVAVNAVLLAASPALTPPERTALKRRGEEVVRAFVAAAGIGETLVYNRLVAALMALDGVLDVTVELYPGSAAAVPAHPPARRRNLTPPATVRPTLDPQHQGALAVEVAGQLLALDVTIGLTLKGAGLLGNRTDDLEDARRQVAAKLSGLVASLDSLSAQSLKTQLGATDAWSVDALRFTVELVTAGVVIHRVFAETDPALAVPPLGRPWLRQLRIEETLPPPIAVAAPGPGAIR
jgi:hypothetical protein